MGVLWRVGPRPAIKMGGLNITKLAVKRVGAFNEDGSPVDLIATLLRPLLPGVTRAIAQYSAGKLLVLLVESLAQPVHGMNVLNTDGQPTFGKPHGDAP